MVIFSPCWETTSPYLHFSSPILHGLKEDAFQHPQDNLDVHTFLPFTLIKWIINQPDYDPSGPSMATLRIVTYSSVLVSERTPTPTHGVESPCEAICKFYQGLNIIGFHAWKLSSDSSERQAFWKLRRQQQHMSRSPQCVTLGKWFALYHSWYGKCIPFSTNWKWVLTDGHEGIPSSSQPHFLIGRHQPG